MSTPPRLGLAALRTKRCPIRAGTDGDFSALDLLHLAGHTTTFTEVGPAMTQAALTHKLWRLPCTAEAADAVITAARVRSGSGTSGDEALLHAFETSAMLRPPIDTNTRALTGPAAEAWMWIALRFLSIASTTMDMRHLNAACKLFGAVQQRANADDAVSHQRSCSELTSQVAAGINRISSQLIDHTLRLPHRQAGMTIPVPADDVGASEHDIRVVVLAGAGSSGAARFLHAAHARGITVAGTCWYGPHTTSTPRSHYDDAWYPPNQAGQPRTGPTSSRHDTPAATTWPQIAAQLAEHRPDLLVLIGMPIVPPDVLDLARLGVINAHNGALPGYRGMDAVGWAMLHRDPVVCTVHHAVRHVDSGAVIAAQTFAPAPLATLRQRVKTTQLQLLLDTTSHAARTGRLPPATPQAAAAARLHYRMHPHLKRILDLTLASPLPADAPPALASRRR